MIIIMIIVVITITSIGGDANGICSVAPPACLRGNTRLYYTRVRFGPQHKASTPVGILDSTLKNKASTPVGILDYTIL